MAALSSTPWQGSRLPKRRSHISPDTQGANFVLPHLFLKDSLQCSPGTNIGNTSCSDTLVLLGSLGGGRRTDASPEVVVGQLCM